LKAAAARSVRCEEQKLSIFKKRNRRQIRKTLEEFNFGGQHQLREEPTA